MRDALIALLPLLAAMPVLAYGALSDLRRLRIPNALSLILLALFAAQMLLAPPPDWWVRVIAAGFVFVLGFIGFARGMIGAGDVKLLSALVLLVPFATLQLFSWLLTGTLLAGVVFILLAKRHLAALRPGWSSLEADRRFPMGISIAAAGILHPLVLLATI